MTMNRRNTVRKQKQERRVSMRKFEIIKGRNAEKAEFGGSIWRVTSARFVDEQRKVHYGLRKLYTRKLRTVRSDRLNKV